jgi:hypothetical protein
VVRQCSSEQALKLNDFSAMIRSTPAVRVQVIRRGVRAVEVKDRVRMMAAPQDKMFNILKLSIATVNREANPDEKLPPDDGARVVGMGYPIGQVPSMIEDAAGCESTRLLASGARACYDRIHSKIHSFFHSFMA